MMTVRVKIMKSVAHIVTAGSVVTAVSQSYKNVWGTPIEESLKLSSSAISLNLYQLEMNKKA